MCKVVEYLEQKAEEGSFDYCVTLFNWFAKNVGKVSDFTAFLIVFSGFSDCCVYIDSVYSLYSLCYHNSLRTSVCFLQSSVFISIFSYKPDIILWVLSIAGVYLLINIVYHYHKARTLPPVPNPGVSHSSCLILSVFQSEGDRWCPRCNNFKSDRTHHCSICGK